jgi:hypothetical protein
LSWTLQKDFTMNSVFQTNEPFSLPLNKVRTVPYKARSISAIAATRGYDSAAGLSAMLLAAMVSALVVVADQLIGTWADGHLMVAWIALWVVGFATLAVFGGAARKLALTALSALDAWSERVAQGRADKRLWLIAQSDARVMADLKAAMARGER